MNFLFHDDDCGTLLDRDGRCPECGFPPDMQSLGLKRVKRSEAQSLLANGRTLLGAGRKPISKREDLTDPIGEWLRSGMYLPPSLRDFHAQKDVFKSIWECVSRKREHDAAERTYLASMNWVDAHIFTIDQFLHFMARHGWTLQRSRQPYDFQDLDDTVKERRNREMDAFRKGLEADREKPNTPLSEEGSKS